MILMLCYFPVFFQDSMLDPVINCFISIISLFGVMANYCGEIGGMAVLQAKVDSFLVKLENLIPLFRITPYYHLIVHMYGVYVKNGPLCYLQCFPFESSFREFKINSYQTRNCSVTIMRRKMYEQMGAIVSFFQSRNKVATHISVNEPL